MMSSSRAVFDLQKKYGTSALELQQRFESIKRATEYIEDFMYNENKLFEKKKKTGGKSKTYLCSGDGCAWEVRIARKTDSSGGSYMYISTLNNRHNDFCASIAEANGRQMACLPALIAAVRSEKRLKHKAVVSIVQARDHVNIQRRRSTFYRVKDKIAKVLEGDWSESFAAIPSMLADMRDINAGTHVQLEVDQLKRFLRCFVALGVNIHAQCGLLPLVGFDGGHSKHGNYNGVVLSLIGRDGNNQNVTLATALVNVENEGNILWFIENCHNAGIELEGRAVFCDRGKFIGASERLFTSTGVRINLRYCTVHILRNIRKKCRMTGKDFENAVWKVQSASNRVVFFEAMRELKSKYGKSIFQYVKQIKPWHWAVHANMYTYVPSSASETGGGCEQNVELDSPNEGSEDGSDGSSEPLTGSGEEDDGSEAGTIMTDTYNSEDWKALPLFKWRSSNFVKSENNAMLENGIRTSAPFNALYTLAMVEMERLVERNKNIEDWKKWTVT